MYKKGFALLLFGIMLAPLANSELQWLTLVGMVMGFIGLIIVLADREDPGNDNSGDESFGKDAPGDDNNE